MDRIELENIHSVVLQNILDLAEIKGNIFVNESRKLLKKTLENKFQPMKNHIQIWGFLFEMLN